MALAVVPQGLDAKLPCYLREHRKVTVLQHGVDHNNAGPPHAPCQFAADEPVEAVWGRAWEFADAPSYFPLWPCFSALGLDAAEARSAAPFALWESVLEALSVAARDKPCLWLLEAAARGLRRHAPSDR